MKYNLIKTDDYLLVVDDSEIKEGDYCTTYLNIIDVGKIHNSYTIFHPTTKEHLNDLKSCKKVITHLPLNNSPILEGVDLLPPLEDDVEKLAWELFGNDYNARARYKDGYNKAKEKYRFTEEDIAKAITYGWDLSHYHRLNTEEKLLKMQRDFIKSLSQPKMPIAFEVDEDYYGGEVKWKINTTTNSDGKKVWVGKYIY
jgi:hypothetical protein